MNISNMNGQTAMFGQISPTTVSNKPTAPIKESERSAAPNKTQQDSANQKNTPNIVIDQQAIALFKENQAQQSAFTSVNSAHISREKFSSASQDKPSMKNETAVANYQAVGNLAQRESVQKMFGVDLFA